MTESRELDPATEFRQLYDQEYLSVYRSIRAVVMDSAAAEDLTQETFVRAYRARHRYTPTAPPGAWLRRIGINLSISHLRRQPCDVEGRDVPLFCQGLDLSQPKPRHA